MHGDEPVVRARGRPGVGGHHPSGAGAGDDVPGHRRRLRAVHQRAAGGPGDRGAPRRGGAGDQVRQPAAGRRELGPGQRGAGLRAAGLRRVAGAARGRPYRPLLPAPGGPVGAGRGHLGGDGRAGRGRQGPVPGDLGGGAGDGAPGNRPPDQRRAVRVVAVHPRPRRRGAGHPARAGDRGGGLQPAGARVPVGRVTSPDDFGEDDFRRDHPRFSGENFDRNLELVGRVKELAAGKGATPSQLAIAWVLAQGDDVVPIPGTKRRRYLENAPAPSGSSSPERTWPPSRRSRHAGRPLGRATSPSTWPTSTPDAGYRFMEARRRSRPRRGPGRWPRCSGSASRPG